jgi:peptidoglycan/xylan/chitin deacetylase (PgdA/CDA1 family)
MACLSLVVMAALFSQGNLASITNVSLEGNLASLENVSLAAGTTSTNVTLEFDDGAADQALAQPILASHGMKATFFVNSGRIGLPNYLSEAQISSLEADGNEIAGHTVSHADLPTLDVEEQKRQVCNDRVALLNKGFSVTSFAYPYGDYNSSTESVVSGCGYNSARTVGGVVSPTSCAGCPYAETVPPANRYGTRTPDSVKSTTTLADLQKVVLDAESHGGGWVQFVMHHVCSASPCDSLSISTTTLTSLLDWLATRGPNGTVVRTVSEVTGGTLQPGVPGPPAPPPGSGSNLLKNPSLEQSADGVRPDCWTLGGFGSNVATFSRTNDAHTGNFAERVDVSNYSDGDRKVVVMQDLGACAPSVRPGQSYVVTAWYKSTIQPRLVAYYRNTAGGWVFWAQAPRAELGSATWAQATWTTPPVPADATALSIGMSIRAVGSLTVDDFGLAGVDQISPVVTLDTPAEGATVAGPVALSASATDNATVDHVDFLVGGQVVATSSASPYTATWDSTAVADGTVSIAARATDTAGNVATSTSHLVTVGNRPPDTTPPTVTISCNGVTCATTPYNTPVSVALSATDVSGVAAISYTTDGSDPASSATQVTYSAPFSVGATTTVRYTATDNASNTAPTQSQTVTVDTTPPTVTITSPTAGTTVSGNVKVTATASDSSGIAKVTYYVDGVLLGSSTSAPYQVPWNPNKVAKGNHVLVAEAQDGAGNVARSAPITVTVR